MYTCKLSYKHSMYILYYTQFIIVYLVWVWCTHSYYITHIHINILHTYIYTAHIYIYIYSYTYTYHIHIHTLELHIYRLYRYVPMVRRRLLLLYLPVPWVTLPRQLLDYIRTSLTYYMALLCTCCSVYMVFLSIVVSGAYDWAWM